MADWQQAHEIRDTLQFENLFKELHIIRTNHLEHIQDATQKTDEKVEDLQGDVKWIIKIASWFAWVGGLVLVGVIMALISKFI